MCDSMVLLELARHGRDLFYERVWNRLAIIGKDIPWLAMMMGVTDPHLRLM